MISNEDLVEFFGKQYISNEVENNTERSILDFLQIASFSINDLIQFLNNTEWLKNQSDEWLIELYDYLKINLSKSGKNAVKKLQIVKLENGEMASPIQKSKIFFPFVKKQVYGFENQLPFIKKGILKSKEFLQDLGVLNPQPFEIIENHILKDFEDSDKSKNWQSKTEEVLIGYINFIKDNLTDYEKENEKILNSGKNQYQQKEDALGRLKKIIWIRYETENGLWFRKPDDLYLTKKYGNENDLEFLFSGLDDICFVHPQYVESSQKEIINNELDKTKLKEKSIPSPIRW